MRCQSVKFLSNKDLRKSFWQVPLKKESKKFTVFVIHGKEWEYERVPFGFKSSSSALKEGLEKVINGLDFVINFC